MILYNNDNIADFLQYTLTPITKPDLRILKAYYPEGNIADKTQLVFNFNGYQTNGRDVSTYRGELRGYDCKVITAPPYDNFKGLNMVVRLLAVFNGKLNFEKQTETVNRLKASMSGSEVLDFESESKSYIEQFQENGVIVDKDYKYSGIVTYDKYFKLTFGLTNSLPLGEILKVTGDRIQFKSMIYDRFEYPTIDMYLASLIPDKDISEEISSSLIMRNLVGDLSAPLGKVLPLKSISCLGDLARQPFLMHNNEGFIYVQPSLDVDSIIFGSCSYSIAEGYLRPISYYNKHANTDGIKSNTRIAQSLHGLALRSIIYEPDNGLFYLELVALDILPRKNRRYKERYNLYVLPLNIADTKYINGVYTIETYCHKIIISAKLFESQTFPITEIDLEMIYAG